MNILYYAVHENNAGWGAESFIDDGFKKLGHTTYCIDYRKHRDEIHTKHKEAMSSMDFDLFFLQRGDGFPLDIIKSMKCKKVFFASELVSRNRDQDRLLESGLFDYIFFHSSECMKLANADYDKSSVLLNGFSTNIYKPIPGCEKSIDILFSGVMTPRRHAILKNISKYFKVSVSTKFGKDLNEEFNKSKIILNIHAEDYLDMETRVYEVLGSKSFLLSERLNMNNPFKDVYHFASYDVDEELIWRLNYYLNNEKRRYVIADNGYKEAVLNHRYEIRAKEIIERIY